MVSNVKQGAKLRTVTSHFSDMSSLAYGKDLNIKKDERQSIYTGLIITKVIRNYRGRVSNSNQSDARKHCFLASDWSKFETLPR